MPFSRWNAQGNVYLLAEDEQLTPEGVRERCGDTDGILEVFRAGPDWVEIAIWNPDGSRAEMSGNGTRIAARWCLPIPRRSRARMGCCKSERSVACG